MRTKLLTNVLYLLLATPESIWAQNYFATTIFIFLTAIVHHILKLAFHLDDWICKQVLNSS